MATRTIGTDIKLTGEKEFNAGMKAMNSNLKTLRTDMAAVSSEFDDNANSMQALAAKQKILQQSVAQHEAKVDALRQKYQQVKELYGENSAQADKYKQQLNQATVALNKETAALEKNADALKEKQLATIKSIAAGAKNVFNGIGTAAGGVAKGIGLISAASAAGVAAIGAGGVAALTTMAGMAREAAEAAKAAHEAGETLTESQQQWLAYSNQLDALDASVAGAKSALAGVLLPMLGDLSTEGAAFLNDFTRDMNAAAGDTGKQTKVLSDYIVKGATLIKQKLPEYIATGKELFSGLADGLSESGPELLDMGMDLIVDLLDGIISAAPQLAEAGISLIQKLTESLIEHGPDLMESAVGMVSQIVMGLAQAAPEIIPAAAQLVSQLLTSLIESAPQLLMAGLELVFGIISGITAGLGDILGAAETIISGIVEKFAERLDAFGGIGGDIVRGIWAGISGATEWIYEKISGWVGGVLNWIKDKLGIASPSKVMRDEIGYWMARGVGVGWEQEMKNVNKQIADSLNTSFNAPDISVRSRVFTGRNYATSDGKVVNLYFYAKTITEADMKMVCDYVNRELGDAM